ncbi:ATP-binding protein [Pseudoroseicyclus aestuarii]|nr:ATP-binding protein [Pseudoroseicyclus aestuarii]
MLIGLLSGLALVAMPLLPPASPYRASLLLAGGMLAAVVLFVLAAAALRRRRRGRLIAMLGGVVQADESPAFLTDDDGRVIRRNRAAEDRFGGRGAGLLSQILSDLFASPDTVLQRLLDRAARQGGAQETIVTGRGTLRLSAQRLEAGLTIWRLADAAESAGTGRAADALGLPMLTAGEGGAILFMNEAARRLIGTRPRTLDGVAAGGVSGGETISIAAPGGAIACLVAEIPLGGGRREIYLLPGAEAPRPAAVEEGPSGRGAETDPAWNAMAGLPVPLLRLATSGRILDANAAARQLLPDPLTADATMAQRFEGLGRAITDWLQEAAEGRDLPGPQLLRCAAPHQDRQVSISLAPLPRPDARRPRSDEVVAVIRDETEHKSLEAQFVQAQKMQAVGQLAGGVAHDFNNLLTAISGHCDLLMLRHDSSDRDYPDLVQIHQNTNRAASLVGQLLAFSRKQTLVPETLDLRDTLADLTHLLNRLVGEKVTLSLHHDPALRPIRADKRQLEQVLMNLVVNARDAMPGGGEIRIETVNERFDQPLTRDRATLTVGDWVAIRVIDAGHGIPAERLPKIFEPFYTTKKVGEGTGLGLSTAYGIVKQTGGYIFADSEVGLGTTFTLYFPGQELQPEDHEAVPGLGDDGDRAGQQVDGVILLVEDEAPVRAFASRALRLRGLSVIEAESAEEALETLSDPEVHVDVIVSDVVMPGKDGPTWVREALEDRPGTRVVFMSGYAEDHAGEQQRRVSNSTFLPKPFSLSELTETVLQQVNDGREV